MPSGRPRPSALLLDADGTLWDTRTAMEAAGAAGVRAAWPGVADDVAAGAARRYRSDPTNVFGAFVAGELTFEEMRRTRLREVAAEAGLPWTDDAPSLFESAYGPQFARSLEAFEDTVDLLRWCAGSGVPVRILTNSSQEYTRQKVVATGLAAHLDLDALCSRDCLGVGKPEPSVFVHACERMGSPASEVLYVGDELAADALGAADAGLMSAWLVREDGDPAGEVRPTAERYARAEARGIPVIGSLREVPGLFGVGQSSEDAR